MDQNNLNVASLMYELSRAWRKAKEEEAVELGTRLVKEGNPLPGLGAETATTTYLLNLPLVKLGEQIYAEHRLFMEVMGPLAGAILKRAYDKEYCAPPVLPNDSLSEKLNRSATFVHRRTFERDHNLPGSWTITYTHPGIGVGYEVNWQRDPLLDRIIDKNGKDRKLFDFARGVLSFLNESSYLPVYKDAMYARIDQIPHLDLAANILAAGLEERRKQDRADDQKASLWRLPDRVMEKTGDKSFFQRVFRQP